MICTRVLDGCDRDDIAAGLAVTPATLKKHLSNIYAKMFRAYEGRPGPQRDRLQRLTILLNEICTAPQNAGAPADSK
jgi:hypothetical protein